MDRKLSLILILILGPAIGNAQSLGEVARQQRAERAKEKAQSDKPTHVYTNDDVQSGTASKTQLNLPEDNSRCTGAAEYFTGVVSRVIDGDTLEVNNNRDIRIRIRLVLVAAPERNTVKGPATTNYLRQLCPVGSKALVDQDDCQLEDDYGRMLAMVWCRDRRVNEEIIRSGHARIYHRFCRQSEFGRQPWAVALGCR